MHFLRTGGELSSMWQLLAAIKSCGLKNDALLDTFMSW